MRKLLMLLVTAFAVAVAGCATTAGSPSPSVPPTLPGQTLPPVEITRTGGIAGVHETLQIGADGHWTYDGTMPATEGQLSESVRARLAELLADPRLPTEVAAARPGQCCDRFEYELRVGDRSYEFSEADAGPVLRDLIGLLHEHTDF